MRNGFGRWAGSAAACKGRQLPIKNLAQVTSRCLLVLAARGIRKLEVALHAGRQLADRLVRRSGAVGSGSIGSVGNLSRLCPQLR